MALAIQEFHNINFLAILELQRAITGLFCPIRCLSDKVTESFKREQVILRIHLTVCVTLAVLQDQDLSVLDILGELVESYRVQKPVPGLASDANAVSVRGEVLLVLEIETAGILV